MGSMHLLFCNTFTCDPPGPTGNWAVVKFPCMIAVDLIKIIAPGVRPHSQLHDDQYIGKTSPGKFRLEIYSDDRAANMTTYDQVGYLDYSETQHCEFRPLSALYSEKLLLSGWFTRLTVAVYGGVLSDVGLPPPTLDLPVKAPSLVIHEKPEGRSVYIRGTQDMPKLTKDLDKPEPLMSAFPPNVKGYMNINDNITDRRQYGEDKIMDIHPSYYDRRRPKNFNDSNRGHHRNFPDERSNHQRPPRNKHQHIDVDFQGNRSNDNDRYRERGRQFTGHQRHTKRDDVDELGSSRQNVQPKSDIPAKPLPNATQDLKSVHMDNSPKPDHRNTETESDVPPEWVDAEYEEISDLDAEEERFNPVNDLEDMMDDDIIASATTFNPFLTEPAQLLNFTHPGMSDFELACSSLLSEEDSGLSQTGNEEATSRFESLLTKAKKVGKIKSGKSIPTLVLNRREGKDWVSVTEEIIPLVTVALPQFGVTFRDKYDEYVSLLVAFVFAGLDTNIVSKQAIGINLRMLKCGVNLADKLCQTTQDIVAVLADGGLDARLVSLLKEDHMASSVKIMILHALDSYLSWPCALSTYFPDNGKANDTYLELVELILIPQAARVASALSRLMNKISLFHAMWKLKIVTQELVESKVPQLNEDFDSEDDFSGEEVLEEEDVVCDDEGVNHVVSQSDDVQNAESHDMEVDVIHPENIKTRVKATDYDDVDVVDPLESVVHLEKSEICQDINTVLQSLNLILHTFEDVGDTITQLPKTVFPTTADSREVSVKASLACMFRMMEWYNVLPSVQVLLSLPYVSGDSELFETSYKLLDFLMSRQDGLLFLAFNSGYVLCLARHLLSSDVDLSNVEIVGTATHLGAKLAFHLQCIQCVDQLKVLSDGSSEEVCSPEDSVEVFRVLYSLTFPTYGKYWTASVLSLDDNILPLLTFVQRVKEEEKGEDESEKVKEGEKAEETKKKSVRKNAAGGFAASLLLLTLKMSRNVSYLVKHRESVMSTVRCATANRYIEEVLEWVRPLESVTDESNVIGQCMEYLKTTFSKLEWNTLMTNGPGLCTALRILCLYTNAADSNRPVTIKKLQSALLVFGGGGLSVLVDAMEQLNKCYEYPCYTQHALTTVFSFNFHNLVTALSENMLTLVKNLLSALLSTNDGKFDFKLLTKSLVEHYAGMFVILRESNQSKLDAITEMIVEIYGLLLLKCSVPDSGDDTKRLNHRTVALQDILSASQRHCQNLAPGALLLSQLLPMPLPITSPELDNAVISQVKKQRESWCAAMHDVSSDLATFLSTMCQSTSIPLLEILIPLAQQIIDLSPSLARQIVTALVSACVVTMPQTDTEKESQEALEECVYFKSHPLMVLAEIGCLPAAKIAIVHCLRSEDNKFKSLWTTARNQAKSGSPCLLDAAIKLVSVLVDPDNILLLEPANHAVCDILPAEVLTDMVRLCCTALESVNLSTLVECLYCLYFLCASDECFNELKDALSANATLLFDMLAVLVKAWKKDAESACVVLTSLCDLMRCLTLPQDRRSSSLKKSELRSFLKWDSTTNYSQHPFVVLKNRIEESECDSDILGRALDRISTLHERLMSPWDFKHRVKKAKPANAGDYMSLEDQFERRPWHMRGDNDSALWRRLDMLHGNAESSFLSENIQSEDRTKVDLTKLAEKNCPGFSLEKSFKDLTDSAKSTDIDKIRIEAKAKRLRKLEAFSTTHGKTLTYTKRSHGLLMTGVRGRGRGRGSSMGRQNDLFRQRKQNTSRPPSMHVDDFIAADEEDNNGTNDSYVSPSPPPAFTTRRPPTFKRDFVPRGRGRGMARNGRGNYSFGLGMGGDQAPAIDKFRSRTMGSHPTERFGRGRGRGRDQNRPFAHRDSGFKPKQPSWNFSGQRNVGASSTGGFRGGGRVKSLMRLGRPLLPPPLNLKWGGMPPPRRGRGYGKPRGKHLRSFTR